MAETSRLSETVCQMLRELWGLATGEEVIRHAIMPTIHRKALTDDYIALMRLDLSAVGELFAEIMGIR